jgi:metal-sulfur cluster biosynthetic enzyme
MGDLAVAQDMPTEDRVREALRTVDDPEVGINIVDLGLVYRIEITAERIRVEMTMTTQACPMGDLITDNARRAVAALAPDGMGVDIELVWEPFWTPDRMSEMAKQTFGWPT